MRPLYYPLEHTKVEQLYQNRPWCDYNETLSLRESNARHPLSIHDWSQPRRYCRNRSVKTLWAHRLSVFSLCYWQTDEVPSLCIMPLLSSELLIHLIASDSWLIYALLVKLSLFGFDYWQINVQIFRMIILNTARFQVPTIYLKICLHLKHFFLSSVGATNVTKCHTFSPLFSFCVENIKYPCCIQFRTTLSSLEWKWSWTTRTRSVVQVLKCSNEFFFVREHLNS